MIFGPSWVWQEGKKTECPVLYPKRPPVRDKVLKKYNCLKRDLFLSYISRRQRALDSKSNFHRKRERG